MKLIIKEYLTQLKESGELDILLPDLLLSMGIEPISHPQIGIRQFGVDVAAVGKFESKEKSLFLFTIKKGDINRDDWDKNKQSIRQSLNDIKDVYLQTHVRTEHQNLKKKIIICTGGIIKQDVELNLNGYIRLNEVKGKIEYEFWGGDKLALLIEKFMFSEQLLPQEFHSLFRRTLSLIGDIDYDLTDYISILNKMLLEKEFGDIKKAVVQKQIKKNLRTINLCINIIWAWSKQEDNIKNSLYAAERTVLNTWQFISKNNLAQEKPVIEIFSLIQNTLFKIYAEYIYKIHKHCCIENGLMGYSRSPLLESLNVFEQLGIIAVSGIDYKLLSLYPKYKDNLNLQNDAMFLCSLIKSIINNHPATKTPLYDDHSIEISETIFLLSMFSETDFIDKWIFEIINNIGFAYNKMNRYFPIFSDSFDDLVSLNIIGSQKKSEFITISTLIPILAQWCAVLDLPKTYNIIKETVNAIFPQTTLQMWYPDVETDKYLYSCNAAIKSGAMDAPIIISDKIEEMIEQIKKVKKNTIKLDELSSFNNGLFILPIISSRHFRTPFLPQYIHMPILSVSSNK